MRKIILLALVLVIVTSADLFGQFRLASDGFVSQFSNPNDSTYIVDVDLFSDLTGTGYVPTGITTAYRVFSQRGQLYRIGATSNLTFSSARLTLVEIDNDQVNTEGLPVGQIQVFDPGAVEAIPQVPFGTTGATSVLQAVVVSYNSIIPPVPEGVSLVQVEYTAAAIAADTNQVKPGNLSAYTDKTFSALNGEIFSAKGALNSIPTLDGNWATEIQSYPQGDTVAIPAGFTWDFPGRITRSNGTYDWTYGTEDAFRNQFRVDTNFNGAGAEVCYVDPIIGDNANDGRTPSTAFQTLGAAVATLSGNSGTRCRHISITPGVLVNTEQWAGTASARPVSIFCPSKESAVIGQWITEPTWTTTAVAGIYKTTITNLSTTTGYILNRKNKDELGMFVEYETGISATTLDPGQQFVDSDTLYIFASDGQTPDYLTNTLITSGTATFNPIGNHPVYLENIIVYGQTLFTGSGTKAALNCKFFYCKNDDSDLVRVTSTAIFNNCTFAFSQSDVIDYETNSEGIEYNCFVRYSGMKTPTGGESADQCSTAHGGARVVRINGRYEQYRSSGIYDINEGTKAIMVGCSIGSERTGYEELNTWPALGIGVGAETWAEGVTIGGTKQLSVDNGTLHIVNFKINQQSIIEKLGGAIIQKW
jgi:hypothetical protein